MNFKTVKKFYILMTFWIYLLAIFGCSNMSINDNDSNLSKNWGKSFHQAKDQQIVNKDSHKNIMPVSGMDGKAANTVYENYLKSFQEKANKNTLQLDIPLK